MNTFVIVFLAVSIILNLILFYRGYRLVLLIEAMQDNTEQQQSEFVETLNTMLQQMRDIDIRGSFESDDEVGVVFKELRDLIEQYSELTDTNA